MSYSEKSRGVPPLPSSLKANSWEMVDLQDEPRTKSGLRPLRLQPHANTNPGITPYLGLRARLSQIWFNRWTVLLLLVLVRVVIMTGSLNDNIADAKIKALSACTKVEDIGSAMASMPHYLSVGVNSLAAEGIGKAVRAMVDILMMILTGVENIIFFVINLYIGTWVCMISALIHGTFDVAMAAVEGATDKFNDAIGTITEGISDDIGKAQDAINGILDGIAGVLKPDAPTIDIGSRLDDLRNIEIDPSSLLTGMAQLNKTIPNFDQVENFTKNAIAVPFNLVRDQLGSKFGNYSFDRSVFPVAEKQALSFCSSNSFLNDFFNSLFELVAKAKIAFAVAIPILAVLAMLAMAWLEIRRWRREKSRARVFTEQGYDPLDVVYIASRPMSAGFGIWLASRFGGKKNLLVRWAVAYGTSLPALFVLSLALAGFFSCFCQWLLLRAIEKEAPALANQVGNFAGDVVGTLAQVSTDWADNANGVILDLQSDINDDVFGWVREATAAVNNTLVVLDEEIDKTVMGIFNNTVLRNTAQQIVFCLVGRKIDSLVAGLTWVHDHARVALPLFPNDTFSQGASESVQGDSELTSFLASPSTVTTDEITSAVQHVITALHNNIVQEALLSTALLLVYVVVVLVGVVWALADAAGRERTRAEGGQRYSSDRHAAAAVVPGDDQDQHAHHHPAPAYTEVIYAGAVPGGKRGPTRYPSHTRKSSYPAVEDADR